MRILLDTHALICYLEADLQLSSKSKDIIEDTYNEIFVSQISYFEITIKAKIGKFDTEKRVSDFIENTKKSLIQILPLKEIHLINYHNIPFVPEHRAPFDRLIIATAQIEDLNIISIDEKFSNYKNLVSVIW